MRRSWRGVKLSCSGGKFGIAFEKSFGTTGRNKPSSLGRTSTMHSKCCRSCCCLFGSNVWLARLILDCFPVRLMTVASMARFLIVRSTISIDSSSSLPARIRQSASDFWSEDRRCCSVASSSGRAGLVRVSAMELVDCLKPVHQIRVVPVQFIVAGPFDNSYANPT